MTGAEGCARYKRNLGRHSDTATSDVNDSDDEAVRLRREAEQPVAAKRERRKVIALNRLGEAALSVRREFVRKLLARKSPPKDAAIFMAQCLTSDKRLLDEYHGDDTAAELLGVADVGAVKNLAGELGAGGDGRAQVILLALILGALESRTPKDAWRHPGGGWSSS